MSSERERVDNPRAHPSRVRGTSLWADAYRRLRRDRIAVACFLAIVGYLVVALLAWAGTTLDGMHQEGDVGDGVKSFADAVLFADFAASDPAAANLPPLASLDVAAAEGEAARTVSGGLFGTNVHGQSVLSRIANGARIAIGLGFCVALLASLIGTLLGAVAGWFGGWVDEGVVWLYSVFSAIPGIMLIMAFAFVLRDGMLEGFPAVLLAMGLTYWVAVCRLLRAEFMKLRDRDYVLAARALGVPSGRIMLAHVLPNTMHIVIISFTLLFVWAIKAEVIISFLGVGFVNEPSWGLMIQDAESELTKGRWWQMTFVSVALFGIVLAFQVFGDALRDALDPRLKT